MLTTGIDLASRDTRTACVRHLRVRDVTRTTRSRVRSATSKKPAHSILQPGELCAGLANFFVGGWERRLGMPNRWLDGFDVSSAEPTDDRRRSDLFSAPRTGPRRRRPSLSEGRDLRCAPRLYFHWGWQKRNDDPAYWAQEEADPEPFLRAALEAAYVAANQSKDDTYDRQNKDQRHIRCRR